MSASDALGGQFATYRGVHLGGVEMDPHDDEQVLSRISTRAGGYGDGPREGYGAHWTSRPETARRFAVRTQGNAGYRSYDGSREPTRPVYGVVLEAHSPEEPVKDTFDHYGEGEVRHPNRDTMTGMVAHVHRLDPPAEGEKYRDRIARRESTHVRSIPVPESHFRRTDEQKRRWQAYLDE